MVDKSKAVLMFFGYFALALYLMAFTTDVSARTVGAPTGSITLPTTMKIVLVQFSDVKWNEYWVDSTSSWQPWDPHTRENFEDMLTRANSNSGYRFDGAKVYGSFRDYFRDMSKGTYDLDFILVNPGTPYPTWVTLPHPKLYYWRDWPAGLNLFLPDAENAAYAQLPNLNQGDLNASSTVKICYIYAGGFSKGINFSASGHRIVLPEREYTERDSLEFTYYRLGHIGYFCHEFGHTIGHWGHDQAQRWSLMSLGHKLGEDPSSCPAPMYPWFLHKAGWANIIKIDNYVQSTELVYNVSPTVPNTYYVREFSTFRKYLVENLQRGRNFDQHLPHNAEEMDGGLLIWDIAGSGLDDNTNVIPADANHGFYTQAEDLFRPAGNYPYHTISDYSTPANLKLFSTSFSHFAIDSFYVNDNTIPVKFITNYWEGTIATNKTWNDSTYVGADVNVASGATLTIASTGVVDLFGNIKVSGGVISRQTNSTLNPDLRLMNAAVIKGQYRSLAAAFGDAAASDALYIASDTTCTGTVNFTCNAFIENSATLSFANAAVVLNGFALTATAGTISKGANVTFSPDIRLIQSGNLTGQYPSLAAAFAAAQPGDAIHLASDDTLHTAWEIPAGITFKVTNEASLVLEGDLDVANGATFLVDEHTYIKCYDHIDIQGGTMEVSPGARLEFDHYSKIKVKGILNAEGTVSDRIVFTSHNGDWTGICFKEDC